MDHNLCSALQFDTVVGSRAKHGTVKIVLYANLSCASVVGGVFRSMLQSDPPKIDIEREIYNFFCDLEKRITFAPFFMINIMCKCRYHRVCRFCLFSKSIFIKR
jgi:hypothetical protein